MRANLYLITYGNYVGGTVTELISFDSEDEASNYAWDSALDFYDSYAGLHGLRSVEDIMDDEGVEEDAAWDIYEQDREMYAESSAELFDLDNPDHYEFFLEEYDGDLTRLPQ